MTPNSSRDTSETSTRMLPDMSTDMTTDMTAEAHAVAGTDVSDRVVRAAPRLAAMSGQLGAPNSTIHAGADMIAGADRFAPFEPADRPASSGKELILRMIVVSALSSGGRAVVFDVAERNTWMASVEPRDSVEVCTSVAEIHARLIRLHDEILDRTRRRETHIEKHGKSTAADAGDQLFLFIESSDATRNLLNNYWTTVRAGDDPLRSPAVEAFESLDFVGPSVNVHVLRGRTARGMDSR